MISRETVIIVVGTTVVAELLDRSAAELLRDEVDDRGEQRPYRRAIVITDEGWYRAANVLANNPVIAVGGPALNSLSLEFDAWTPTTSSSSTEGKYLIGGTTDKTGFFRKNAVGLPQVGLWGLYASDTREAVEYYINNEQGLSDFLNTSWK